MRKPHFSLTSLLAKHTNASGTAAVLSDLWEEAVAGEHCFFTTDFVVISARPLLEVADMPKVMVTEIADFANS